MNESKKIGIWGIGLTGRSAANYFQKQGYQVWGMDRAIKTNPEKFADLSFTVCDESEFEKFFEYSDYIFSSGGVEIETNYAKFKSKWIHEIDFFQKEYRGRIIGITGSFGKSSITTIITHLLKSASFDAVYGGNIGIPSFELLKQNTDTKIAVLEISSFQLEHIASFAPSIAIITNICPNHLDRHKTFDNYVTAKLKILQFQSENDQALLPLSLRPLLIEKSLERPLYSYFIDHEPTKIDLNYADDKKLFYVTNNKIFMIQNKHKNCIADISDLFDTSFPLNWVISVATLHLMNISCKDLKSASFELKLPEHRFELVGTREDITFFNDSKSTVPETTIAAVNALKNKQKNVVLFIGGLSKGVDRSILIQQLSGNVSYIHCFGKEAEQLASFCAAHAIPHTKNDTLEEAFQACIIHLQKNDQVLFSPAGSSYDLFANFIERGKTFKKLVDDFIQSKRTLL